MTRSPLDIRPIDAFLGEYDAAARASIFRCAAARLIQTALEVMHGQPAPTPLALELFTAGERLMARPQ